MQLIITTPNLPIFSCPGVGAILVKDESGYGVGNLGMHDLESKF